MRVPDVTPSAALVAAQKAAGTVEGTTHAVQTQAKDLGTKAVSFAEQNVNAAFDLAHKLVQAKDPQSLMALHGEFVQAQMQVLAEQARELTEIASRTARDSTKPSP